MKLKIAFSTAALILAPQFALAAGCSHSKQVMSCSEGSVYDAASQSCVATTT
ncbi:hypothetical protein [uncultured Sulfitobacter sp.]|uniref:hypothetical protein n=1 Tax=uncultured Sulfitobacter sp. TaxID=191468 RepID=UPI002620C774|nr:hypothetical protein [uncultured Sulfitobacter sp.]